MARRIADLERLIGRPLFDRRAKGYLLTAEGKAVLAEAHAMDEAALAVLRRLDRGTELSGLVRLAAGRVLAERFLIDRLRGFHQRYPAIDLEVIGGSRVVSLAKREADVALRYGSPKDSELVARRVATITFGLYASPAYRDKLKAGDAPTFIGFDEDNDFITESKWLNRQFGGRAFHFAPAARRRRLPPRAPTTGLRCCPDISCRRMSPISWAAGTRCLAPDPPRSRESAARARGRRLSGRDLPARAPAVCGLADESGFAPANPPGNFFAPCVI